MAFGAWTPSAASPQTRYREVEITSSFLDGLRSYVNNRGYGISYQSVDSGTSLDFNACKNAIDNNKVVALLAYSGNIYNVRRALRRIRYLRITFQAHILWLHTVICK